jgi:sulfite dehydrogenase
MGSNPDASHFSKNNDEDKTHPRRPLADRLAGTAAHADQAAQMARGKELFTTAAVPACAVCHTLKDAGAEGAIGPVLDELQPDAARVARALKDGIGSMPSFKATMSEADIAAVALYVSKASGGAK